MFLSGVHKYLKAYGCLIKDFRHDERGGRQPWRPLSSRCLSFLNGSIRNLNCLRAKTMDSHPLVTPAIFKPGSMVFKTKEKAKTWIPDKRFREWRERRRHSWMILLPFIRHPWMVLSGVHSIKKHGCLAKFQTWQKEKPSEREGRFRELAGREWGWISYKGVSAPL